MTTKMQVAGKTFARNDEKKLRLFKPPVFWVLLSFLLLFVLTGCASREEWDRVFSPAGEDTVSAGQVIDNDILLTGTNVVMEGEINGDLFAIGNTVTINGPVSGSVVALGQAVEINSEIGGSLYSGARNLDLGPNAQITNNAHFVGLRLETLNNSLVQRDLVVASLRGRLSGDIGRSLNGFILLMTLNGSIGVGSAEDASGSEEAAARLPGVRLIGDQRIFIGASSANDMIGISPRAIFQRETGSEVERVQASDLEEALPAWLFYRLTELALMLPLGLLLLWLIPWAVQKPAKSLARFPLPSIGYGILGVIVSVNVVAIAILLVTMLLFFGIWLGTVFSWTLAFVAWAVGFPALMLAFALFALAVVIGSKVVVADWIGTLIFSRVAPKAVHYWILPFLLGLLLYIGLRAIPTFGLVLEAAVTILGLGGMWVALQGRRSPDLPAAAEMLIPGEDPEEALAENQSAGEESNEENPVGEVSDENLEEEAGNEKSKEEEAEADED